MSKMSKILWVAFWGFVAWAIYGSRHESLLSGTGPLRVVRLLIWAAFLLFTAYSFYCSRRENLFTTVGKINKLYWGRQIGMDLYIGLSLTLFIVYLNEGSLLVVLLWLLPTLMYANLVTLLYFALHFDSIVAKLSGGHM